MRDGHSIVTEHACIVHISANPYYLPFNQAGFIKESGFVLQISAVIVNSLSWKDYSIAVVRTNHPSRNTLIIHLSNDLMS